MSKYILDCKRYHGEFVDITWRDCDVRKWLNDEFYNTAFNAGEEGVGSRRRGARTTERVVRDAEDKVFLLSVAEVKSVTNTLGKDLRRAIGTEFAKVKKADGGHLYVYDKSVNEDYVTKTVKYTAGHGGGWDSRE